MSNITVNQHFVPRLLLKNFCAKNDESVRIFDSSRQMLRPRTSIRRILAEKYFYDDDNSVENFLAEHVEGPASKIIDAIVEAPRDLIPPLCAELMRFISVQMRRTPQSLEEAWGCIDKYSRTLFDKIGEMNEFPAESTKGIRLEMDDKRSLLGLIVTRAALDWPLISDLSWHVIQNETSLPFVISDNPVIQHNWYLRNSRDVSYTSIANRGVQLFIPLSPLITLALVDKTVYKYGEKGCNYSPLTNISDVKILNDLQFRSRGSFMVFSDDSDAEYVKAGCKRLEASSISSNNAWASAMKPVGSDHMKSDHVVWRTQVNLNNWLSICRIKRKFAKIDPVCEIRCPEIISEREKFWQSYEVN